MERAGGESQAVTGLHSEPRSRTHQVIFWSGEKQGEVGCKPADWAEYPGIHLTLIRAAENDMCRKCDLEQESFHFQCECNALAGIRQKVLGQAYPADG